MADRVPGDGDGLRGVPVIPFSDANQAGPWGVARVFIVVAVTANAPTGAPITIWTSADDAEPDEEVRDDRWDESLAWGAPVRIVPDDQIRGFRARSRTCSGASRWRAVLQ